MHKGLKIGLGLVVLVVLVLVVGTATKYVVRLGEAVEESQFYAYDTDSGLTESAGGVSFGVSPKASVPPSAREGYKVGAQPGDDGARNEAIERLIIKSAEVAVVVEDVPAAVKIVSDYAEKNGGFVVTSNVYKSGISPVGRIKIRIPVNKFDEGLNNLKSIGEVQSQSIDGEDVTEQYVDLEARLRNMRASESQFLKILSQATKITDILAVQSELNRVRLDIESMEGKMKFLRQSADLSSIEVSLSTDPDNLPAFEDKNTWKPLAVLKNAVRGLLGFGKGLVNVLIWLVVFIPLWLLIALIIWVVVRQYNKRRANRI